jgi:hypothetical protein
MLPAIDVLVPGPTHLPDGVVLKLEVVAVDPSANFDALRVTVAGFLRAAAAGFFSPRAGPQILVLEGDAARPGVWQQNWRCAALPVGVLRILLNLLGRVHRRHMPMAAIRLHATSVGALGAAAVLSAPFPPAWPDARFEIVRPLVRGAIDEPRIRLVFVDVVGDAGLVQFEAAFKAWDDLVVRGGFGNLADEILLDDGLAVGETYMLSPDTVEHTLEAEVGAAAALDAVVNFAMHLDAHWARVAQLEIE